MMGFSMFWQLTMVSKFEEVQTNGGSEGCEVGPERPPVIGVENAPRFDVSDCTLDWCAQAAHVCVELPLPFKQFPVLGFLDRGYVSGSLISFVANAAECRGDDFGGLRFAEGSHVVIVAGDGLRDEYDVAREIGYDLAVEACGLMLSRPQARCPAPGPARRQEAVYQDSLTTGGRLGALGVRAELCGSLLDKRRYPGDDPGDGGLRGIEDLSPDVLDDILAGISGRHDDGFSQGESSGTFAAARRPSSPSRSGAGRAPGR